MRVLTEYHLRLLSAPREIMDYVLWAHGQLRIQQLTDADLFDGDESLFVAKAKAGLDDRLRIVGVLMWSRQDDESWWTQLGYVDIHCRGKGVYQRLWRDTVELAISTACPRIQGGTAWNNANMRRLMEHLGRRPAHVMYDFVPGVDRIPRRHRGKA